jgi:hypothetical protein
MTMHPNELDLLDLAAGQAFPGEAEVAAHVATCEQCAAAVQAFAASVPIIGDAQTQVVHHRAAPLAQALHAELPTPAAGQLWRAEWDGVVQLLVVVAATDTTTDAMPVIEADGADDTSLELDPSLLGWRAAVIAAEVASVPIRVLDRFLGVVSRNVLDRARAVAAGDPGDGDPIVSPLDERWGHRAQLHENLVALTEATWVPETAEVGIVELLRAAWDRPSALAKDLGTTPGHATELLTGKRPLNDDERREVGRRLGRDLGPAAPPAEVLWALDHPTVRPSWRAKALRSGTQDTSAFRWATYANSNFALAARTTGGLSERERWLATVKQVLDDGA